MENKENYIYYIPEKNDVYYPKTGSIERINKWLNEYYKFYGNNTYYVKDKRGIFLAYGMFIKNCMKN